MQGEELALEHMQQQGMQILEQRWKDRAYELDIIAFDPATDEMVFVEVKTRSSEKWGHPEEAIDMKKIRRCVRAANYYLRSRSITYPARFDVYSIVISPSGRQTIEYFKDAFYPPLG